MTLLRLLIEKQHELGYLSDDVLRGLSVSERVPLYRLEELVSFYTVFRRTPPKSFTIDVCRDVCCAARGCKGAQKKLLESLNGRDDVEVREVSCLGRCDSAPAFTLNDIPAAPLTLNDGEEVLAAFQSQQLANLWEVANEFIPRKWKCDPYANGIRHYQTVQHLVEQRVDISATCIEKIKATNLTGRGGAGFPTGLKWEIVSKENSETKYVICNADESEPGTFKDREILRHLPHLVLEGMLLAGLTIGSETGIVYIRHEYGPEREFLEAAIQRAYELGILGEDAAGSGQRFDIEVFVSPGGYILGEETALLEALEDKRGEPRNKPPYPGQIGLWGQPTLINNVETFALATSIVHHGPEWWHAQGLGDFSGLKFVSISGDVNLPGVFEVPMGTTFNEVIEMAGGMLDGKTLKAFLPGGASSLFMKPELSSTPIDFDAVKKAGSMLGTGAIMVFHEDRNLYELATNITRFFRNESCGKCVPCRVGSEKGVELLEAVGRGEYAFSQLSILRDLNETLLETSICGLGQVALAPALSMLKHFPDEIPF